MKQKIKSSSDLDSPIHDAKLKMDVCKENFDKQKDTIDKFAKTLRSKLHIGEMCPVCLQKVETELPHEEELSALVLGLQKAYDDAEKEYKKLNDTKIKLEAEINRKPNRTTKKRRLTMRTILLFSQRKRLTKLVWSAVWRRWKALPYLL